MRQAGRYMEEYRKLRAQHDFLALCKKPEIATEITITPVQKLKVDAAILFADILLILEPMGVGLEYSKGDGPVIHRPVRNGKDVDGLKDFDVESELSFVYQAVKRTCQELNDQVPLIGFAGAPFTLASYLIEGGGSRNYVEVKKMMYRSPQVWDELLGKLNTVLTEYIGDQVKAGADVIQVFDSWVGCLSVDDYRQFVLPRTKELIQSLRKTGVPIIYFGTDSTTLLPSMNETEADVIGLDWRVPFDEGWKLLNHRPAVQGNLDPVTLFSEWEFVKQRAQSILDKAGSRPGHIFNLGHGILPLTPVDNVKNLAKFVQEYSAELRGATAGTR